MQNEIIGRYPGVPYDSQGNRLPKRTDGTVQQDGEVDEPTMLLRGLCIGTSDTQGLRQTTPGSALYGNHCPEQPDRPETSK